MNATPKETTELALYDAVAKLIKAKGRFHTEQNYAALVRAFDATPAPSIPAQPGSGEARTSAEVHRMMLAAGFVSEYVTATGVHTYTGHIEDAERLIATPAPADSAPMQPEESAVLTRQVSAWRKEVARLQDLIGTATGQADSAAESVKQSRELWQDAISQAAFYVLNHCESGEYHAEAISTMPLPTFTSRGLDSAAERDAARYEYVRTLHPHEFANLWRENIAGGGKFDDLVDAAMQKRGK